MAYSHIQAQKNALEKKLYRAKVMSGGMKKEAMPNPDFAIQHPDWVRDAMSNPTPMNVKIKEKVLKYQKAAMDRRLRFATG